MKKLSFLLPIVLLAVTSCQPSTNSSTDGSSEPSGNSSSSEVIEFVPSIENGVYPEINWDESQQHLREGLRGLEFFSLNDFHGATQENGTYRDSDYEPGISKISTYLNTQRETYGDEVVFVNAGDMWQGTADSNITKGALVTDWLNLMDCKAMAIGNHEYDWKVETIENNVANMDFPLLGANVINEETSTLPNYLQPYTAFTQNGINIGIIGTIGQGLTSSILAENVEGLVFDYPEKYVKNYSEYLRSEGADVILYLTHAGSGSISNSVAQNVDAIFLGHTHYKEQDKKGIVPMIQAACNGEAIGQISIDYDFELGAVVESKGVVNDFTGQNLLPDNDTEILYGYYLDEFINDIKNEVVGYSENGFSKSKLPFLMTEYMARYVAEIDLEYDITFTIHNSARDSIPAGDITYGDIYKAFPFDNALTVVEIVGSELQNFLNVGTYYGIDGIRKIDIVNDGTYYVLTLDYLSQKYIDYSNYSYTEVQVLHNTYPRDIFKTYIGQDYPPNR